MRHFASIKSAIYACRRCESRAERAQTEKAVRNVGVEQVSINWVGGPIVVLIIKISTLHFTFSFGQTLAALVRIVLYVLLHHDAVM